MGRGEKADLSGELSSELGAGRANLLKKQQQANQGGLHYQCMCIFSGGGSKLMI
jgi:hypothetical protein